MDTIQISRREVPVEQTHPEQGRTAQQVQLRLDCGWGNQVINDSGRSEKQIILQNCLTFFK